MVAPGNEQQKDDEDENRGDGPKEHWARRFSLTSLRHTDSDAAAETWQGHVSGK